MEKVEKFKSLCQELQKRKLDLDKEVNNYVNVSSTNSKQSKLCINSPLHIDAQLLWKQAIGSNSP